MFKRFYTLQNSEVGAAGGGSVDRGDNLEPEVKGPTAEETAAAEAAAAEEAAAAALAAEIEAKEKQKEEGEGEEDTKKKDSRIPASRHKEILEKEREKRTAVEQELAKYKQGGVIADVNAEITSLENSVATMEKEYAQLLTDGEIDKATAKMGEIRKAERAMAEAKSDLKIQAAEIRNTERARYNITLERIEAAYPTLNPDHDDFDEEIMDEVVELKDAYQLKGFTPTQALQKAVKLLVEPRTTKQEIATSSEPRVPGKDKGAERKAEAVAKTVKAVGATPPSLDKVGMDSNKAGGGALDAKAVMNMSQKEFAALNPETLALMRGDTI